MASNLLIYTNVPKVEDERICPICSEEAPPGEAHHPHYGGICCYGCRAFFRRANQRSKRPKLNCKGSGNCPIAPKGEARCKKCRYEKCLSVGMDPKWVMTQEQKQVRFQHYYKKKMEKQKRTGQPNASSPTPSTSTSQRSPVSTFEPQNIPELIPINTGSQFKESRLSHTTSPSQPIFSGYPDNLFSKWTQPNRIDKTDTRDSMTFVVPGIEQWGYTSYQDHSRSQHVPQPYYGFLTQRNSQILEGHRSSMGLSACGPESSVPDETGLNFTPKNFLQPSLKKILDAYTVTSGKHSPSLDQIKNFVLIHQLKQSPHKLTLITQLSKIAAMTIEYSSNLSGFKSLNQEDRVTLLRSNVSLYLQYILARYFCCQSGLDQISWILDGHFSVASQEDADTLQLISLHEFNSSANVFPNVRLAELYHRHCINVGMYYSFPLKCNGLIAKLLLLRTNESILSSLVEPSKVTEMYQEVKKLVNHGLFHLDASKRQVGSFGPLLDSLEVMRGIFDNCVVESSQGEIISTSLPVQLLLRYTETEERWLQERLNQFQDEFKSVTPPEDLLHEGIQLVMGKEVSSRFVPNWMNLISERIRRVLKSHSEFQNLTGFDQASLMSNNIGMALAISGARMSLCRTGKDQMRFALGIVDSRDRSWERNFDDLDRMERMPFDHPMVNQGKLNQSALEFIQNVMMDIMEMVSNDQIFQLFTLVTLLDTEGLSMSKSFSGILQMRQIYLKLFQRKLKTTESSCIDYAKFHKTLQKIKIYSRFMESYME